MAELRKMKTLPKHKLKKYFCSTCRIFTNSDNQFNQHLDGYRHKHRRLFSNPCNNNVNFDDWDYNMFVYVPAFVIVSITTFIFLYSIVGYSN